MLVNIQSISDLITNSSSEVFVTDSLSKIELLDKAGIEYIRFNTEEDIKNYILSNYDDGVNDLDEVIDYNPYSEYWAIQELLNYHTKEEIWEFYKPCYIELLGKVFVNVDRDYYYRQLEKVEE